MRGTLRLRRERVGSVSYVGQSWRVKWREREVTGLAFHSVCHQNGAVLKSPALLQLQIDLALHRMKPRYARPEQNGVDIESDFIDQPSFEHRPGQFPAAHQADISPTLILELADKANGVFADDRDAVGHFPQRPREHEVLDSRVTAALTAGDGD